MAEQDQEIGSGEAMALAWTHFRAWRLGPAEEICRSVAAREPQNAEVAGLLGVLAHRAGRREEAIAWMERAAALRPGVAGPHANLSDMYRLAGLMGKAIAAGRRALSLEPGNRLALSSLGLALLEIDDVDGALECLDRHVRIEPGNAALHLRRSMLRMLNGDIDGGLEEYEWRLAAPNIRPKGLPPLRPAALPGAPWKGERLLGKKLFLWSEQGLGDALHCMRFFPTLIGQGPLRISAQLPPKLHPLIERNFPYVKLVPHGSELEPADYHCELMSLLRLVGRSPGWAEPVGPYLTAPEDLVEGFNRRFAPYEGIKVGLVWSGNSNHRDDARRSMPGPALLPLLATRGCRFFSLQIGPKPQDKALFDAGLVDLSAEVSTMTTTAAAVAALDLVIGVDTSLVHLAGALGTPVWTLLCSVPDWRWGRSGQATPLYRSMRFFRQRQRGDWPGVVGEAGMALSRAVEARIAGPGGKAGASNVS